MSSGYSQERFIEVYNDRQNFPNLTEVALELGVSYQTVRNQASILKGRIKRGEAVPGMISRVVQAKTPDNDNYVSPKEHAKIRADRLRAEVAGLLTSSRYPVVNPEAIVVESFVSTAYDRVNGLTVEKEGTPRTWLSDTLRVQGIEDPRGRKFIFTSAQNDAEVHEEFWNSLTTYAEQIDADIIVGPLTYETQWWSENNPASRSYDEKLEDSLCFGKMRIGNNFEFCGEMNTLPTARRPISDLTTYSQGRWAVFPHPMLQLKSVPSTNPEIQAHQVMTTGSVTKPKIIPRKAGVKSIFHQILGATVVEFDQEGDIFCRQINADDDGSFYDLEFKISGSQVSISEHIESITCADIHVAKLTGKASVASFGFEPRNPYNTPLSIMEVLQPRRVFLHDLHDNESRNHHHVHDNAHSYEMAIRDRESVQEEVQRSIDFVKRLQTLTAAQIFVVDSNHDIALERYVREGRYRHDGINIRYGMRLENAYLGWREEVAHDLDAGRAPSSFSMLEWAMRDLAGSAIDAITWVHDGKSELVGDVECGHHGFRGANGARGTVAGYAQLGRKMSIGDKHSPEILDGVYVSGVMGLQHGYNKGPSGWAITHTIQYPNGKRALITLQNGKWRG